VVDAREIAGALVTAAALCLEPFARRATINPIRYRDVWLAGDCRRPRARHSHPPSATSGIASADSRKDVSVWRQGSSAEHVRRLQSVTDAALAHLRLDELLQALLERTREMLEVETCAILLLDEETNELVARAALGIEEEVEQGVRIPVGGGFAGRIAAEKRPVVLDDVDHSHVLNPILREKGIKSMMGVPLIVEGEVSGVLHIGSLVLRDFRDDEIELLQLVADRAALAIEHARAFEAERAARERIENVQLVTDAALSHLEVDELLSVLLPRIREILRADTCAVLLLDEETDELVARAALGIEEEVGVRIPLGAGFAGKVAGEARPMVIDVDEYEVYNPILREKQLKSMLGVPLLVRGASLGVLHVGTLEPREFTRDDVEVLQLVAERVAISIERARLHEDLVQLDQLKLNFVAIASHELRTPATSVYGVLKTLAERGDQLTPELREELLLVGVEQGERLRRLLEELLDLSRLDARAISVKPRPVVLKAVLADVVAGMSATEAIELDIPDNLAAVVDPLVVERVISNLVANATRYGAPPIRIEAQQRDRHLRVAVEDAGPGIPEELEGRIFDRFARGTGETGHGLGLAIARAYAQAHGGDLVYDPRAGGARFELLIPQERNGISKPG
jgi:signal transduction histidine kinase